MPSRSPLVLAVDIGTSSVRTALFDDSGNRVGGTLARREHSVEQPCEGAAEFQAASIEGGVESCMEETLGQAGGRPIDSVGVSCFWHSLLGTDAKNRPLTPVYTWADSRCREDASLLRAETSEEEYHRGTGCMLRASFWPAKLRWLARTNPKVFRRVKRWQSPADWLRGRFCEEGEQESAYGMATGTGLFDPSALGWDLEAMLLCDIHSGQLPAIGESPATLRPEYARRFPALRDARWWPAIGDGAASNLGSGATRRNVAAINVGTSAAFRVMREGAVASSPFGLFCYRVDAKRFVVGGAVSNAGNLRAWCRRELALPHDEEALDRELAKRPGPLTGLVTLPFWSAERAPTWCEDLGGVIYGLSQQTSALDLLQSTTEAVYHRLAMIADLSLSGDSEPNDTGERRTPRSAKIIVSGGILESATLLQRLANVLGRGVYPSIEPEASLRGAAVYALEKMGKNAMEAVGNPETTGAAIQPQKAIALLYAKERERQRRLESLMSHGR